MSHHARLIINIERKQIASSLFEQLNTSFSSHVLHDLTSLDIHTARTIISWAITPASKEKTAVISFHTATGEAQNALLKIVEEPPVGVSFIFVTSSKETLLPTFLSRLSLIDDEDTLETNTSSQKASDQMSSLVELFLTTDTTERLKNKELLSIMEQETEDGKKDREGAKRFLFTLLQKMKLYHYPHTHIEEVINLSSALSSPSTSIKYIFEYLSFLLAVKK
ncbi:MAG: polymerase delta prime subunit [Candidatus Parcubacteria bacterium]|jgi:hypothetical protein